MKIGMVSSQFGNFLRGGAEVQFENTVKALKETGVDVQLINENEISLNNYDMLHFFKLDESYSFLTNYLKEINIPYVISPIFFPESVWSKYWYLLLSYLANVPGLNILCGVRKIKLLRGAASIFPNTKDESVFLKKIAPNANIVIVPNAAEDIYHKSSCIDSSIFLSQYPQLKDKQFVLTVGRIEPRKNQLNLIQVCKDLELPLVIIGQIRDKKYWEKCLSIKYHECYYVEPINDKELLISAYKACHIFALPSTMETPGLAALEAGLQGAKILITKYGGTMEYFGNSAIYVDPFSKKSISEGFRKLLDFKSNKDNKLEKYNYNEVALKYKYEYEKIIL